MRCAGKFVVVLGPSYERRIRHQWSSTRKKDVAPPIVERMLIKPPLSRRGPVTPKGRAVSQSISPVEGKYDTRVDRESAAEVLAIKAADAAATAVEVAEKGREEVAKRERKTPSMWEKAGKSAMSAAGGSLASMAVAAVLGKKSSADPLRTGATAFVRNLLGGPMR